MRRSTTASNVVSKMRKTKKDASLPEKLHGYEPDTWRYRIGNYRIFYIIENQIINVVSIDHRKDAYW
ncbi:MAG: type II toxin-antitoxin system RelE/ParE family toxin [Smithella sp.]